ncbi:unnamed protein product [Diplocarpon coronariae]
MKIAGRQAQVRKRQGSYTAEYSTTQRKDVYTSTSRPFVSQGIHGVKQEVQAECERLNPDVIRLEDGPKIWFDAARDTIFDAMSLYSLKQFTDNNPPTTLTAQHHGFDLIQNLETPLSTTAGCLDRARNYFSARPIKWNLPVTRRKYQYAERRLRVGSRADRGQRDPAHAREPAGPQQDPFSSREVWARWCGGYGLDMDFLG